jgi:hypothetical protein
MHYLYALIIGIGLFGASAIGHAAPDRTSTSSVSVVAPVPAIQPSRTSEPGGDVARGDLSEDEARYAEREAQSSRAQEFRGGDTVIIGTSAVLLVLVIVLIVVLI